MPNTKLLIKLRDLHGELSAINDDLNSAEQVDDEAIDALGQLVTDACELVDRAKIAKEAELTCQNVMTCSTASCNSKPTTLA